MSYILSKRRLIPRWRRVSATLELREAQPLGKGKDNKIVADMESLERAISDWRETPTAGHLGDVLSYSVASDCTERIREVTAEALRRGSEATEPQTALMHSLTVGTSDEVAQTDEIGGICNPHVRQRVQQIRQLLRLNPANPLVLLDFAQLQIASGNARRAERSISSALALSPNNRLVLRTAARFLTHIDEAEKAHRLLARHSRTPADPWLMASEIAVAQVSGRASKFARPGMIYANQNKRAHSDISELTGALGGLELSHGNAKKARDLFRLALINPNDNVIAQAITERRVLALDLNQPEQRNAAQSTVEAKALLAWEGLNAGAASINGHGWHAEEPFSSRPLQFLTSLYAATGNYAEVISLAKRGLISDSRDAALMANLGYAYGCVGELEKAESFSKRAASINPAVVGSQTVATLGLVAMKRGNFAAADELYQSALRSFGSSNDRVMQAICYAYYARTAFDTDHPEVEKIAKEAVEAYKRASSADAAIVLQQLKQTIEAPVLEDPVRRLGQWVFDPVRNEVVHKRGVTQPGAPLLLIKD